MLAYKQVEQFLANASLTSTELNRLKAILNLRINGETHSIPQKIVVSNELQNVPREAIYLHQELSKSFSQVPGMKLPPMPVLCVNNKKTFKQILEISDLLKEHAEKLIGKLKYGDFQRFAALFVQLAWQELRRSNKPYLISNFLELSRAFPVLLDSAFPDYSRELLMEAVLRRKSQFP